MERIWYFLQWFQKKKEKKKIFLQIVDLPLVMWHVFTVISRILKVDVQIQKPEKIHEKERTLYGHVGKIILHQIKDSIRSS